MTATPICLVKAFVTDSDVLADEQRNEEYRKKLVEDYLIEFAEKYGAYFIGGKL